MARPRPIDPDLRDWLRARVDATSVRRVARELDLTDTTVLRVLAGIDVQAGTAAIVRDFRVAQKDAA